MMMALFMRSVFARLMTFRKEVVTLWHAFFKPETPLFLKFATIATLVYLLSPIDIIPEFIPGLGFLDDLIIVPLMVRWIVGRLPQAAKTRSTNTPHTAYNKTINGTARRK